MSRRPCTPLFDAGGYYTDRASRVAERVRDMVRPLFEAEIKRGGLDARHLESVIVASVAFERAMTSARADSVRAYKRKRRKK